MKILHTLIEGGQTWAHRVRMIRQVFKVALSFSMLATIAYLIYSSTQLDPLLYQSGYYRLKAEIASYLSLDKVVVSPKFWEKVSHEKIQKETLVSAERLKRLTHSRVEY